MSRMTRIAITLGDPAGIGPEVVAKWLAQSLDRGTTERTADQLVLVGNRETLESGLGIALKAGRAARADSVDSAGQAFDLPSLPVVSELSDTPNSKDANGTKDAPICLLDTGVRFPASYAIPMGKVDALCGRAAVEAVEVAARACLKGQLDAMVTAPINKESVNASGCADIGHQEMLARLAGVEATATMLMTPGLRVAHLSTHKSLANAVAFVTRDTVFAKLQLVHDTLTRWGLPAPRIAVAALNPHGGEGGLLGREEIDELVPAVRDARAQGIEATGPIPADSVFNRAINGEFDVVLALFHDQGHIAIKVHDFHNSVTATLGVPLIRTSVDHGTAFDIAGQGVADASGMAAAVAAARALAAGRLADFELVGHSLDEHKK